MNTTIILVIIIVFAFVASRLLKRHAPAYFAFSGAEYLALGVVLGPLVTNFVQPQALLHLEPVISLLLGVVGFTLGLMFREHFQNVRVFAPRSLASLIAIAIPGLGCYFFLRFVDLQVFSSDHILILSSATIGVVASVSSTSRIDAVARLLSADGWVTRNLRGFSVVSDVIAVFCFGIISAGMRTRVETTGVLDSFNTFSWLGASILIGFICGILFIAFLGKVRSTPHIFLATLGCVIFASGVASALGLSPLFVNLIVGVTLALFSPHTGILRPVIQRLEHPTLILLLIFAGIVWVPLSEMWLWAFVPIYLLLRFVGLRTATGMMLPLSPGKKAAPRFGMGLLAQGVIAVAIAVDYRQLNPESSSFVLTTLLLAVLAQDFLATRSLRRVLADAEELYTDMILDTKDSGETMGQDPLTEARGG